MRITLTYVNNYLVQELIEAAAIVDIKQNGYDVIQVELTTGELVAIHLVERDIDLTVIRAALDYNARDKFGTLFILWAAMLLPEHGEFYLPYDWMLALLDLYDDKIYAYEAVGGQIFIFPIYFDRELGQKRRHIRYGDRVTMSNLATETIHVQVQPMGGVWKIAHFEAARTRPNDPSDKQAAINSERNPLRLYYEILGLDLNADEDMIRKAYRALARQFHPDLNPSPEAAERMKQINTAYTFIMAFFEGK